MIFIPITIIVILAIFFIIVADGYEDKTLIANLSSIIIGVALILSIFVYPKYERKLKGKNIIYNENRYGRIDSVKYYINGEWINEKQINKIL